MRRSMRKYLAASIRRFIGGTGTRGELAAARKDYGIARRRQVHADGSYTHRPFVLHLPDRSRRAACAR